MVNLRVMLCLELGPVKPKQVEIYILTDLQLVVNNQVEEGKKNKKNCGDPFCLPPRVLEYGTPVNIPVHTPYINAYVIQNKLVLS
jgi:hypothetical protein